MDVADVILSTKRQFGDETGAQIEDADIIRWINEGQLAIVRRIESEYSTASIPTVVDQESYSLPSDFFKISSVFVDDRFIQILSKAQMRVLYPSLAVDTASAPRYASVSNRQLTLAPKPSSVGTITLTYVNRPPLVHLSSEQLTIPVAYHPTLITYCLAKAKQLDGNMDEYGALTIQFSKEVGDDMHDERHKEEETYPFIRTSPGDA